MYSLEYWVLRVRLVLLNNWPEILFWVVGSLLVAWLFGRKGYEFWRFFLISMLTGPFLGLALYLLQPVLFPARSRASNGKKKQA